MQIAADHHFLVRVLTGWAETNPEANNFLSNSVVATTRHSRTNDLTSNKALQWAIK